MTVFILNNIWRFRKIISIIIKCVPSYLLWLNLFQMQKMPLTNDTALREFIFLGFVDRPELQALLSVLFLVIYLVTDLGNLGTVVLIRLDSHLHTGVYFFVTHSSFVDLCYTSTVAPPMLTNLVSQKKTIRFAGCFMQRYLFIALLLIEFYMLAAMAYDCSVAICNLRTTVWRCPGVSA